MNQIMQTRKCLSRVFTFAFCWVSLSCAQAACDCTYALLYDQNAGYSQIAVDDFFVYFGDNLGNIKRVPKAGGAVTVVATYPGNRVITGIAVDANNIYFGVVGPLPAGYTANVGDVASVPKTGGSITTLTTQATNVIFLDVDATHVYWDSYGHFPNSYSFPEKNGFIGRVPIGGGVVETIVSGLATSDSFALDGGDVYFGETGYVSPSSTTGALKKVAKTGGSATTLYSGVVGYVSTDASYVYCSSHFDGQVFRVPKAGGARQVYLSSLVFPAQVKYRDNQLYFAVDDNAGANGFVGVLDVNSGASQILKSGIPASIAVAVDDCAVYGMGKDGNQVGTVHRICRPSAGVVPATQFSLATTSVSVSEGSSAGYASIQINRTGDTTFTASVGYKLVAGTALVDSDYTDYSILYGDQAIEFQAGVTSQIVNIPITKDTVAEPDESFGFYLSSPTVGAGLGSPTNAVIAILDNDRPGPGKPIGTFTADIGTQFSGTVYAVARQNDDRIVVGGQFSSVNETNRNNIARILSGGPLDLSFDPGTGPNSDVYTVAVQADGKAVIAGYFSSVNGVSRPGCARLDASGALDAGFTPPSLASFLPTYYAVVVQPDGKVLIGGSGGFNTTNLARLNTDGTLDSTVTVGSGTSGSIYSLALQADGKVLVGGSFTLFNGSPATNLVRLEADGAVDATFDARILGVQFQTSVRSIIPLADGKILIGGGFTNVNGTVRTNVARLMTNGVLDASFAPALSLNGSVMTMAVQSDGKALIGGGFNLPGAMRVARLNTDGGLDTSFDVGAGPNGSVYQVLSLPSGDVLVGGGFTTFNELPAKRLVVLRGAAATPAAPAFLSFAPLAGQFRVVFSVVNGSTYILESSTNLTNWTGLQTNTSNGSDITFTDSDAPSQPYRFYRIKLP